MTETIETKSEGINWYHPAFLIATWFGVGKSPKAPGTVGSFFTFPLFILSHYLLAFASSEEGFIVLYLSCTAALFVIGTWATNVYMKKVGRLDPKEVVIDEVVGQTMVFFAAFIVLAETFGIFTVLYGTVENPVFDVTMSEITHLFISSPISLIYAGVSLPVYLLCFGLFRLFDIWKPWPISYCDKNFKGGFGVMFDDVFAAVYASIVLYLIGMAFSY